MTERFGVVCIAFDDTDWISAMIEGCHPVVDRLFFMVSRTYWTGAPGSNEGTLAAIRAYPDLEGKIEIIEGEWPDEVAARNTGLALCRQYDLQFAVIVDADEIYDPGVLGMMMEFAKCERTADAWILPQTTYWKTYRYKIDSTGHNGQLGIVRIGEPKFVRLRTTTARRVSSVPLALGVCHHLSYVRTNDQMLTKLTYSPHASEFLPGWFNNVWLRWDEDHTLRNLHPTRPRWFPCAVLQNPQRYPPALRKWYDRDALMSISS